ncbi:MAG: hypothetical protein NDF56_05295 [archaeon GB-1845-036]|nr:hypothetical protein [Candidatus Culexmicrobium thermophilum]HDO20274.1 hypothetical protein [Candidatus Bathyarchaeota archaeon]
MPRRLIEKKRKTGYMYFNAKKIRSNMRLEEILDVVFTRAEEYKRTARAILEGIKDIANTLNRRTLWIDDSEMSNLIRERIGWKRRSLAYRVLSEFLIPMGFIDYRPDEGRYIISRAFQNALVRLGSSYGRWVRS